MNGQLTKQDFNTKGFLCIDDVYTSDEIAQLANIINQADSNNTTFRKNKDLFAIRQFLKEVPDAAAIIFNVNLKQLISNWFSENYFVTKSIYFDKPEESNWFVAYHQDLTISVDKRIEAAGFGPWTVKQNQFAVQPPIQILENNFTVRIHLDDTTADNGALKVIPGSHCRGVQRAEELRADELNQTVCAVQRGGVMLMRPLLFHASNRTLNSKRRRVIHIEFSNAVLPYGLQWSEKLLYT